jgi:hypothetical protein
MRFSHALQGVDLNKLGPDQVTKTGIKLLLPDHVPFLPLWFGSEQLDIENQMQIH